MKIYKFGKIPTGSVQGMKGMLRLIDNNANDRTAEK